MVEWVEGGGTVEGGKRGARGGGGVGGEAIEMGKSSVFPENA
jgi:hypothetical protein